MAAIRAKNLVRCGLNNLEIFSMTRKYESLTNAKTRNIQIPQREFLNPFEADIHLADLNNTRPYIYVAADEVGRCLAIESHVTQSSQQTIDFIERVISEIEIQ